VRQRAIAVLSAPHIFNTCPDFHCDPQTEDAYSVLEDGTWIDEQMKTFRNNSEYTKEKLRAKCAEWRHNAVHGRDSVEGYWGLTRTARALERHHGKIWIGKFPFEGKSPPSEPLFTLACLLY